MQYSLNLINPVQIQQQPRKGIILTLEGKSRQMEKIKNIIQKFRKHSKYTTLYNNLSRIGLHEGLNSI